MCQHIYITLYDAYGFFIFNINNTYNSVFITYNKYILFYLQKEKNNYLTNIPFFLKDTLRKSYSYNVFYH